MNIDSIEFKQLHEAAILCSDATFNDSIPAEQLQKLEHVCNPEEQRAYRLKIENVHREKLNSMLWLERPVVGDASESALIRFFQPIQDIAVTRQRYPIAQSKDGSHAKLPFNSTNKFMLKIYESDEDNCFFRLYMKVSFESCIF